MAEVNKVIKQHRQMADTFKMMARQGPKGLARMLGGMPGMGGGGGMSGMGGGAGMPDMAELQKMAQGGQMPDLDALKKLAGSSGGLPGLGGLPPGFNPFKK